MKKRVSIILNIMLLVWFGLDMTGLNIGNKILVTQACKDDGIFMLIFLGLFFSYVLIEKIGKYTLSAGLTLWFVTQFFSHWYFTIFGPWEGKKRFFADTIPLIKTDAIYIPDLYHVILHILILGALISTAVYIIKSKKMSKIKEIPSSKSI